MTKTVFILGFLFLLFLACNNKEKDSKEGENALARVLDQYLYKDDIREIIPPNLSKKDSLLILNKYINSWVRQKLLINKAEQNLSEEQKKFDKQIEDYRNSLITYEYEKELVKQKLDTLVNDNEIEAYYANNQSNFELKDNIIKVLYIKLSKKAPDLAKVKAWYKSDVDKDKLALDAYCHQHADNYYLDENTWLFFDDILKEIPIQTYNQELFLRNNKLIEVEDSTHLYLLNIKGFKVKNSLSPLAFEKDNIRNIIVNKRKLELIEKMKQNLFESAVKNKEFEIFTEK